MRRKCGRRGKEEKPIRKLIAISDKEQVAKRPAVAAAGELLRVRGAELYAVRCFQMRRTAN